MGLFKWLKKRKLEKKFELDLYEDYDDFEEEYELGKYYYEEIQRNRSK